MKYYIEGCKLHKLRSDGILSEDCLAITNNKAEIERFENSSNPLPITFRITQSSILLHKYSYILELLRIFG